MEETDSGTVRSDLVIRGQLSGKGDLLMEGRLEGSLALEGRVTVRAGGAVTGPVGVQSLEVQGQVEGDVTAHESIEIQPGGVVRGSVRTKRLSVHEEGTLTGDIEMEMDLPEELLVGENASRE